MAAWKTIKPITGAYYADLVRGMRKKSHLDCVELTRVVLFLQSTRVMAAVQGMQI